MRCVYLDLDGTLLGPGASLLRDGEGRFALEGVRALQACARSGAEVMLYSGRRQSSVFVFQGHEGPFRKHIHVTHDEVGYVLNGSGSVTVGNETRPVRPGDVWVIPANTPHSSSRRRVPSRTR